MRVRALIAILFASLLPLVVTGCERDVCGHIIPCGQSCPCR